MTAHDAARARGGLNRLGGWRRALAGGAALVVIGLTVTLAASAAFPSPEIRLTARASGDVAIANSREGLAILSLAGMRPSDSSDGSVTLENVGDTPGTFALATSRLADVPGAGGGTLSRALVLTVSDMTNPDAPFTVYSGRLDAVGTVELGTLAPAAPRTYAFAVTFPDGGAPGSPTTGDNSFQGASARIQFDWSLVAVGPDVDPPETTIASGPSDPSTETRASFAFASDEGGSSFECSLDGGEFERCSSPKDYATLATGSHRFSVRAVDAAGNTDPTPAAYAWTIVPPPAPPPPPPPASPPPPPPASPPARPPLTLAVTGPKSLAWAKRSPIPLRVVLSERANVTARLHTPRGAAIYTWTGQLGAGPSTVRLSVRRVIRTPGAYTVRITATAYERTKTAALRVRIRRPRSAGAFVRTPRDPQNPTTSVPTAVGPPPSHPPPPVTQGSPPPPASNSQPPSPASDSTGTLVVRPPAGAAQLRSPSRPAGVIPASEAADGWPRERFGWIVLAVTTAAAAAELLRTLLAGASRRRRAPLARG